MKNIKRTIIALSISLTVSGAFTSCSKYEEGPAFSIRSKKERIANTWRAERIIEDGNDETDNDLRITFSKEGSYSNNDGGPLSTPVSGTWTFTSDKEEIQTIVDILGVKQVRNWRILKLEEKSLWLREGNTEYHLIPA